jgi:hypothetical protein
VFNLFHDYFFKRLTNISIFNLSKFHSHLPGNKKILSKENRLQRSERKRRKKVETIINKRPVRKFNYKTPNEVHLLKESVGLIA